MCVRAEAVFTASYSKDCAKLIFGIGRVFPHPAFLCILGPLYGELLSSRQGWLLSALSYSPAGARISSEKPPLPLVYPLRIFAIVS